MEKLIKGASACLSAAGAYLSYLLGGWDTALSLMFIAMALDYVTGICAAFFHRSDKTQDGGFRSSVAFRGITKKLMMVVVVMLGVLCDTMLGTAICRLAVISFYIANEGLSILENAHLLGAPVPQVVLSALHSLKSRGDSTDNSEQK